MGNDITIPYSGRIHNGIQVGTDVVISGRVHHNCSRFSINLCVGPTYDQDCALHFNPRMDDNKVVRNHMQGGAWGREETAGGNPFHKGHGFELHIKCTPHGYKITVNNRPFCEFNHRLPKESLNYIYIEGQVHINYLQFRGGHGHHHHQPPHQPGYPGYAPTGYPTGPVAPPPQPSYPPAPPSYSPAGGAYPGVGAGPVYNPPVPYTGTIPGGLHSGKIIYVTGVPNFNPTRFSVNLQCGPYDGGDFALHFDVRFNYGNDRNQVIRTHQQGGNYGPEERAISHFPFQPNASFEMMILTEPSSFKIAVNNMHFVEFFHRIQPFQRADHVQILGDVRISQIRFQ